MALHSNKALKAFAYPVTRLTFNEIFLLTEAYKRNGTPCNRFAFLNGLLEQVAKSYPSEKHRVELLERKLSNLVNGYVKLANYHNSYGDESARCKIWIKKLLKHNGY